MFHPEIMFHPAPHDVPNGGSGAPASSFRGRALPQRMSLAVAVEAERLIAEWVPTSGQPDQLATALFRLFAHSDNARR